jgi:hypothetical protein
MKLRPSPSLVISLLALFVALGGTAVAVSKIGSNDIARNAVRSKHIAPGQVQPSDLGVVVHRTVAGEEETTSIAAVPLTGPVVKLSARAGEVLGIDARFSLHDTVGGSECYVNLDVSGPDPVGHKFTRIGDYQGGSVATMYMTQDVTASGGQGTANASRPMTHSLPIAESGKYTIRLTYQVQTVGTACGYSDRHLWVHRLY